MNIKQRFAENLALAKEEGWDKPEQVAANTTTEELVYSVNSEQDRKKWEHIDLVNRWHYE